MPDEPTLEQMLGHNVAISSSGVGVYYGKSGFYTGVLDDFDEMFLYVKAPDGELLCLPRSEISLVKLVAGADE